MNETDEALVALLEELESRVKAMPGETMATIQIRNTLPLMIEQIRERGEIFPDLPLDLPRHYIVTASTSGDSFMVRTKDIGTYLARAKAAAPRGYGWTNVMEVSDAAVAAWPETIVTDEGVVQ